MNEQYWNPMVPELMVTDFDKSLSFYCDVLGFSVRNRREHPDFAYLECEQVHIMLESIHDKAWTTGDLTFPLGRGTNFQMEFSDIEPVLSRLQTNNITLFCEPTESWYDQGEMLSGRREFLVQDPDGYLLRFSQFLGEKPKT